jgi:hypothetical protein
MPCASPEELHRGGQRVANRWTKRGRQTCHRGVHPTDIRQKGHLGKVCRKFGRFLHLLPECLGTPWRTHQRMNIEVPEGDRSSSTMASSVSSVLLRRQSWVRKDAVRRRENVVEKVILQVLSGQRLGLLVLYCECLSAGERRASGRFRKYKSEKTTAGAETYVLAF